MNFPILASAVHLRSWSATWPSSMAKSIGLTSCCSWVCVFPLDRWFCPCSPICCYRCPSFSRSPRWSVGESPSPSALNYELYFLTAVRTWQVFLAVSSAPSLLSGFLHIFLPESPKFLMSQGNYKKALDSLQRIYKLNKRKSRESYPVLTIFLYVFLFFFSK